MHRLFDKLALWPRNSPFVTVHENCGANSRKDCAAFAAPKPAQKETVKFSKHPQRVKCTSITGN